MKVAVIGATGTIGSAVATAFEHAGHEVVRASRSHGVRVDIEDPADIRRFFAELGPVDAVVSTAGRAAFGNLDAASDEDVALAVRSKLMGQVNLVRYGLENLNEGGVFVLTSGILARAPWPGTSAVAMVNAALEGFVRAAALDLGEARRIEVVSPPLVRETAVAMGMGETGPTAAETARAYLVAIEGSASGQTEFVEGYAA